MFGELEEDFELDSNSSVREADLVKQKSAVRTACNSSPAVAFSCSTAAA